MIFSKVFYSVHNILPKSGFITNFHRIHNLKCVNIRCLSNSIPKEKLHNQPILTKNEILEFDKVFPSIIKDLINEDKFKHITEVALRFEKSLEYNVPKGKKNRGLAVVACYKILEKPENLTPENLRLAAILGWSVEMLQGFLLVLDDIMDGSETRRGQLCWYKHNEIGYNAINDGLLLEHAIYLLLKKHLSDHPSYLKFVELFHDVTLTTTIGQLLDGNTSNVKTYTMERYDLIAYYKTAYYSFYLPVCLALYFTNHFNQIMHQNAKNILLEIGKFFQIQDDFLDCFGDPKVTGKIGSDIETGKCTWLAVTAFQLATASQKSLLEENYGKNDPQSVKKIKDLYLDLEIPKLFTNYEKQSYKRIESSVDTLPEELPRELFAKISSTIYKRVY
ncbi:hypothetical protein WA026_019013 [Henosepilachna vigintioctopunctata]|uniref:Farnesyl pyrophosphate synthase n=1 Tax=Henosepilachna vigintioctopunctata TaxID=420089 RepID=A0AAW1VFG5_9CUCU